MAGMAEGGMPYPDASTSLKHPPLKFIVWFSGYASSHPMYRGFYEHNIVTSSLHVLECSDPEVSKEASWRLVESCRSCVGSEPVVVWHPGGHFVPKSERELEPVAKFIASKAY
ncbi:hypothetical protein M747DRAFT_348614 [Aspergillus niger ATCC 13496]|nr:hypothetical protein M747DRAFT_348614 [Aspergillus niger ATCC 13496]